MVAATVLVDVSITETLIASVIAASVPDASVFKSGRDFTAWLGLTPKQNSSGGKDPSAGSGARRHHQ